MILISKGRNYLILEEFEIRKYNKYFQKSKFTSNKNRQTM